RNVLEGLLAKISELNRDLSANVVVGHRRNANAPRRGNTLKSCRDIYTISKDVITFDQNVSEVNPDPKQHTPVLRDTLVALSQHRLHSHRPLNRIDHRRKLKQPPVSRALHEASPVLLHERIGDLAVFSERAGRSDLVEAHEPRVARDIGCNYRCEPASD